MIADEPTRLRVIDTATVDNLTKADPAFAARLYRSIAAILAERLRLDFHANLRRPVLGMMQPASNPAFAADQSS